VVEPNTTPQNRLVRWGLLPLINTSSNHITSNVGLIPIVEVSIKEVEQITMATNKLNSPINNNINQEQI